jgi:hypothetical protein
MLKNYAKELTAIALTFGLISYTVYVCAAESIKTKPVVVTAKKEAAKPVAKKEAAKPAEVKKEHKKLPTLKKNIVIKGAKK